MKFSEIEKFPHCNYRTNVDWRHLERWLHGQQNEEGACKLDLDPDFQRGHVWSESQQISYLEYMLRGGTSGTDLYFNCVGWMSSFKGPYVIVDGKQRLEAVRKFLRNELRVFGHLLTEFDDPHYLRNIYFTINIAKLESRLDVLKWYLDFNSGGTVHSNEELDKVRKLMEEVT